MLNLDIGIIRFILLDPSSEYMRYVVELLSWFDKKNLIIKVIESINAVRRFRKMSNKKTSIFMFSNFIYNKFGQKVNIIMKNTSFSFYK